MIDRDSVQDALHRVAFAALIYFPEIHAVDEEFDFTDQVAWCLEPLTDELIGEQKDDLQEIIGLAIIDPSKHREAVFAALTELSPTEE